jgi:4-hydroxybenzoate polyprenyltransferase
MKILKILLLLLAIGVGAYALLWVFGLIASLFWYLFWISLLVIGGTVSYKLFLSGSDEEVPKLDAKRPTAISELEDTDKMLEEYREKFVPKD